MLTSCVGVHRQVIFALFTLTVMLAGCSGAVQEVQPFIYGEIPWSDGEVSLYEITDVNGDYAGTARYDLIKGGPAVGPDGWTFRREIVAHGDNEIVVVEVTDKGLRPKNAMLVRTNDDGTERVETTYDQSQVDMKLTTVRDVTTYQRSTIPSDARDQRTILTLARLLPLENGYATRFNSYLPVADLLDRVTLQVVKREQIDVPAGTFDTWRVRLDVGDSRTDAWLGAEAPYPLVKFEDGRSGGTFELMEFQADQ